MHTVVLILIELLVVIGLSRLMGLGFERIKQPLVIGEIVAGSMDCVAVKQHDISRARQDHLCHGAETLMIRCRDDRVIAVASRRDP